MIPKPINASLTEEDLQTLIDAAVRESKTIEYKRQVDLESSKGKEKFLAGVCSFANTNGGDFVIGMDAEDGVPTEIKGIEVDNLDAKLLQIQNLFADTFEPRIPNIHVEGIEISENKYVLVVRIPSSRQRPHRLKLNNHFYARHMNGKYPLDIGELREAFLLAESQVERVRAFSKSRIDQISGQAELPGIELSNGARFAVHFVPLSPAPRGVIDMNKQKETGVELHPTPFIGVYHAVNLEGLLTYSVDDEGNLANAYSQIFRDGSAEVVFVTAPRSNGARTLYTNHLESIAVNAVKTALAFAERNEVQSPFVVFGALVHARGYEIGSPVSRVQSARRRSIDRDRIELPDVVIEDYSTDVARAVRPLLDALYHAFGLDRSPNFDGDGNWIEPEN